MMLLLLHVLLYNPVNSMQNLYLVSKTNMKFPINIIQRHLRRRGRKNKIKYDDVTVKSLTRLS